MFCGSAKHDAIETRVRVACVKSHEPDAREEPEQRADRNVAEPVLISVNARERH